MSMSSYFGMELFRVALRVSWPHPLLLRGSSLRMKATRRTLREFVQQVRFIEYGWYLSLCLSPPPLGPNGVEVLHKYFSVVSPRPRVCLESQHDLTVCFRPYWRRSTMPKAYWQCGSAPLIS